VKRRARLALCLGGGMLAMAALAVVVEPGRAMRFARKASRRVSARIGAVALTPGPPPGASRPRDARFTVDCGAPARPISPLVYGIAGFADEPAYSWTLGATARRWGGDVTSRYNWELGDAWNLAYHWYFRNVKMSRSKAAYDVFLEQNREHGVQSALVVPMLGWVAKDTTSYSFPVSAFGPQQSVGWDHADAGNGIGPAGARLTPGPPTMTSVRSTPENIERWVRQIREKDRTRGRSVHQYILDNEPMSWSGTHRDVHPDPVGYDELLERTISYATAVRRADPEATIAGPAESDWVHYHYSAKDMASRIHWDRLRHGNVPLIPWYLRKIREHEQVTGTRILDVLDVHHYSSAPGVGFGASGSVDAATAALRIRQTRSLWDPSYVDESWLDEPLYVVPLLRRWIDENHPGLGISIGEWSFGAETHMSGGLATAEALGRFGTEGVTSAFYWTYPADRSPAFWAFRAYRNFDGAGGRFLDVSVPVRADASFASLFASRDEDRRHLVAVLLNLAPGSPLRTIVDVSSCGDVAGERVVTYAGGSEGFRPAPAEASGSGLAIAVEPYTITVLDLTLGASQAKAP